MPFPVDERFIEEAERALGRRLPAAYRASLRASNGGEFVTDDDDWQLHPVWDRSDATRTKRTCNHIVAETEYARRSPGVPADAVVLGTNGGGDLLLLLPDRVDATSYAATLYRWDHETATLEELAADIAELASPHHTRRSRRVLSPDA